MPKDITELLHAWAGGDAGAMRETPSPALASSGSDPGVVRAAAAPAGEAIARVVAALA